MSAFGESIFTEKLKRLTASQQSIQTLGHWIVFHRAEHARIVDVWMRELRAAKPDQKLAFLYLMNDVAQTSKRHGNEFIDSFSRVIADACSHVFQSGGHDTRTAVLKTVKVLEDRLVFPQSVIADIRRLIASPQSTSSAAVSGSTLNPTATVAEATATTAQSQFQAMPPMTSASASALIMAAQQKVDLQKGQLNVVERKVADVRPVIFTGELLKDVKNKGEMTDLACEFEDAIKAFEEHEASLNEMVLARTSMAEALAIATRHNDSRLAMETAALNHVRTTLAGVDAMKRRMKEIYDVLPEEPIAPPQPFSQQTTVVPPVMAGEAFVEPPQQRPRLDVDPIPAPAPIMVPPSGAPPLMYAPVVTMPPQ